MAKLTVPIVIDWDDIKNYVEQHDIVEIVRCKYCKHFGYYKTSFTASFTNAEIPGCFKDGINRWREVKESGFCDMGERRE